MDWRSQLLDGLKARDDRIGGCTAKDIPNVFQSCRYDLQESAILYRSKVLEL